MLAWPSGLRRQLKALVRKGVGSNPTADITILPLTLPHQRVQNAHQAPISRSHAEAHNQWSFKPFLTERVFGQLMPGGSLQLLSQPGLAPNNTLARCPAGMQSCTMTKGCKRPAWPSCIASMHGCYAYSVS